jgi:hypothetical protein
MDVNPPRLRRILPVSAAALASPDTAASTSRHPATPPAAASASISQLSFSSGSCSTCGIGEGVQTPSPCGSVANVSRQRLLSPSAPTPASKLRRDSSSPGVPESTVRREISPTFYGEASTASRAVASNRRPFSTWTIESYKSAVESQRHFFWQRASVELREQMAYLLSRDPTAAALWETALKEYGVVPTPSLTSVQSSSTTFTTVVCTSTSTTVAPTATSSTPLGAESRL